MLPTRFAPARPILLLALLAAPFGACAPSSKPAEGPIGDQVTASIESGTGSFGHGDFTELLEGGVVDGLVNYDHFAEHRDQLSAYLDEIADANLASLERDHLMALLINAYNAYTIVSILDHPDVDSIRDIDGVWDARTHPVGGFELTLDAIEHNLLRPYFKDPRIHFAVNCASQSCAPLPPWAFEGDPLEEQLAGWTRQTLADPKYLEVDGDRLLVTRLLSWYGDDFTAEGWSPRADSLAAFLAEWGPAEVARLVAEADGDPPIAFKEYDWALNDV